MVRAHSRADRTAVWASGSNGVVLRSVDSGHTWSQLRVSDGDKLDFRGVRAFDADTAYLMSSGEGGLSRIYKTVDGGKTWQLQYTDKRPGFFLDAIACSDDKNCFALSDPVDGKFVLLQTRDGEHWSQLPSAAMPAALPKEGAFAASDTALALEGENVYFVTGGPAARVFHSPDRGHTWRVVNTPIASGVASAGVFSIAVLGSHLVLVGGDYKNPNIDTRIAAYSDDSGATWHLAEKQPSGYRSAVSRVQGPEFVAVGPNGSDISRDGGIHWLQNDHLNLNAIGFLDDGTGWAVGPNGTVARFTTAVPVKPH